MAQVYKILLPRKVQFLGSQNVKKFSLPDQKVGEVPGYFVFRKEDKPDFYGEDEVIWDGSRWGIYKWG